MDGATSTFSISALPIGWLELVVVRYMLEGVCLLDRSLDYGTYSA